MPSRKKFVFADFNQAFGFMTRVAWWRKSSTTIRNGSTSTRPSTVTLSTHDAGGLTERDIKLAEAMDKLRLRAGISWR